MTSLVSHRLVLWESVNQNTTNSVVSAYRGSANCLSDFVGVFLCLCWLGEVSTGQACDGKWS